MTDELFCPKHGPYPASKRRCPVCAAEKGELPPAPAPLFPGSDESTIAPGAPRGYSDDDETILPGQPARGGYAARRGSGADESTQPPLRGGRSYDEDETQLPERKRRRGVLDDDDDGTDVTVIDRQETGLIGWLIVKTSRFMRRGHILKIKPDAVYGRSSTKADIVLSDEKVSSIHVRFKVKDNKFFVVDLGSSNGTFVNGEEVVGTRELQQDDEIRLGETVFVLKTLS